MRTVLRRLSASLGALALAQLAAVVFLLLPQSVQGTETLGENCTGCPTCASNATCQNAPVSTTCTALCMFCNFTASTCQSI